jgi:membrane protein YqaA with SNARE-associated domain
MAVALEQPDPMPAESGARSPEAPLLAAPGSQDLSQTDTALGDYVRGNLLKGLLVLVLFLGGLGALGFWFEEELLQVATAIAHRLGVSGLAAIVLLADSVATPIPPDLVLIVVAKSPLKHAWWWAVPLLGAVSVLAGNIGFLLGGKIGNTRLAQVLLGSFRERNAPVVARYGWIAVALGAFTPIPFSVTCWAAGMLKMRWVVVAAACCLRLPRFVLFYWLITHSSTLSRLWS